MVHDQIILREKKKHNFCNINENKIWFYCNIINENTVIYYVHSSAILKIYNKVIHYHLSRKELHPADHYV